MEQTLRKKEGDVTLKFLKGEKQKNWNQNREKISNISWKKLHKSKEIKLQQNQTKKENKSGENIWDKNNWKIKKGVETKIIKTLSV